MKFLLFLTGSVSASVPYSHKYAPFLKDSKLLRQQELLGCKSDSPLCSRGCTQTSGPWSQLQTADDGRIDEVWGGKQHRGEKGQGSRKVGEYTLKQEIKQAAQSVDRNTHCWHLQVQDSSRFQFTSGSTASVWHNSRPCTWHPDHRWQEGNFGIHGALLCVHSDARNNWQRQSLFCLCL